MAQPKYRRGQIQMRETAVKRLLQENWAAVFGNIEVAGKEVQAVTTKHRVDFLGFDRCRGCLVAIEVKAHTSQSIEKAIRQVWRYMQMFRAEYGILVGPWEDREFKASQHNGVWYVDIMSFLGLPFHSWRRG